MGSFTAGAGTSYLLSSTAPVPSGTANGVLYLNGSKVVTSEAGFTFASSVLTIDGGSGVTSKLRLGQSGVVNWDIQNTASTGLLNISNGAGSALRSESLAAGVNAFYISGSGNVGLGVTPSAWNLGKAFEINFVGNSLWGATTTQLNLLQNAYWNGGFKYANSVSSPASYYSQISGVHSWHTATPGTAGNPVPFTQAMTLDANGRLGIGTTGPGFPLDVRNDSATWELVRVQNTSAGALMRFQGSGGGTVDVGAVGGAADTLVIRTATVERIRCDANGNTVLGTGAIATNAANGFLHVAGCAGVPTGTPTAYTGRVPIVVDTTNNKLYFYSNGAWRDAGP